MTSEKARLTRGQPIIMKNKKIIFFLIVFLCPPLFSMALEEDPLVDVHELIPDVILDVRYATSNNFLKKPVYPVAAVYLKKTVAQKLKIAADDLRTKGYRLIIFDGYRPLSVQKQMWVIMPDSRYVANPSHGSMHNRGGAVDLTLVKLNGEDIEMPSEYDDFSPKAHHNNKMATPASIKNANVLKEAMEKSGFKSIATEWWHYQDPESKKFPVLDVPWETLLKKNSN